MDIINQYGRNFVQKHEISSTHGDMYSQEQLVKILKLVNTIEKQYKFAATILLPQRSPSGKIIRSSEVISFSILLPSKKIQYQYVFRIDINLSTYVEKITATVIKNGRLLNVQKQGIIQSICYFTLSTNRAMNIYSLRIHPYTGVVKYLYVNHVTPQQIKDIFLKPVDFCSRMKDHIEQMADRLNERLLGKILYMENQISLKQILPSDISQKLKYQAVQNLNKIESKNEFFPVGTLKGPYTQSKKLKQAKRYLTNSTIKSLFFSKDVENCKIRFAPQLKQKRRQKDMYDKNVRHNYKIMPFSKDIKRILMQYTANNDALQQQSIYGKVMDASSVEPTPAEIKDICQLLQVDSYMIGGKIYSPIMISSVEGEVPIGVGGFAQISRLSVYVSVKQESQNPELGINNQKIIRQTLVRKSAAKQKLYWEKQVIKHIGKGSCVFINRFYEAKISPQSTLNRAFFDDSILMQYCVERALNNYLSKMNSVISLKNKIFVLFQVSMGLRYLKDYNTVHLDMKPENILIKVATNLFTGAFFPLVKIIDFGQAFCDILISRNKNRGHTCPYASPELVRQVPSYNEKSDVFSLGVMILVIVFELNTVDIKRLTSCALFKQNQDNYVKFYSICPEKCRYYGFEPVMQCLLSLAYKCIHPNIYLRPYINWVSVILRALLDTIQCFEV